MTAAELAPDLSDAEATEILWLPATRAVVLRLTEISLVAQCRVTAKQGRRLQTLFQRHPRAYTVRDALAAEGVELGVWLAGEVAS
jgi:hypothetical protein